MLPSLADYELLVYSLPSLYSSIRRSTLVVIRRAPAFAELAGVVEFENDITLTIWEDLNFARNVIQGYSYAVDRRRERLYWYDPQPHPNDPSLSSTFPHHKHVPSNIKRHRVPAPDVSFERPNLPFLIEEIAHNLLTP